MRDVQAKPMVLGSVQFSVEVLLCLCPVCRVDSWQAPFYGVLVSVILRPRSKCEDRAPQVSSLSVDTLGTSASGASVPCWSRSLPSTCPGPHACCTWPSPHLQPRWSLPGQLSCLPHGSVAPRTGLQETPAGQGAWKQESSWDAQGY